MSSHGRNQLNALKASKRASIASSPLGISEQRGERHIQIAFESSMRDEKPFDPIEMVMVARSVSFMFVWYAMLWSVIEALETRSIVLRGPLAADITRVRRP
jgi:hypothetical protein